MEETHRATLYLDARLYKVLKLKAVHSDRSISDLVNEAIRMSLAEDAIDLEAIRKRAKSPEKSFEGFLKELRKDGLL